jgi:4-hydroxy-3-polyprenylbenzoate decarboxylase
MPRTGRLIVAVTGASGALYAIRFLRAAAPHFERIYVMLSKNAGAVYTAETGRPFPEPLIASAYLGEDSAWESIAFLDSGDFFSPPASGSFLHDGMVIIPCSMGTLGRIASGISNDLTTRAADVCLKERRKLILVTRDTPLSLIHLRNMVTVTEAGAMVLPAVPAFYYQPKTVEEVVDTVAARVLQNLEIPQTLMPQWQSLPEER